MDRGSRDLAATQPETGKRILIAAKVEYEITPKKIPNRKSKITQKNLER
jgi:hypothetical protein